MSEEVDEDQWLYGSDASKADHIDGVAPVKAEVDNDDAFERPSTPTLDDLEHKETISAHKTEPVENWVAPDLVQKQKNEASVAMDDEKADEETEAAEKGSDGDSSSDEDDDDDVQIHIGAIKTTPSTPASGAYSRAYRGSIGSTSGPAPKKVEMDGVGEVNGVPLFEYDLDANDKPWKLPGADITDYFNYGFSEETWKLYCERQRQMKSEVSQLTKTVMASSNVIQSLGAPAMMPSITQPIGMGIPHPLPTPPATSSTDMGNNVPLIWYRDKPGDTKKSAAAFVPPPILPPMPVLPVVPPTGSTQAPTTPTENDNNDEREHSKSPAPESDGRATPELDNMEAVKPIKGPLLPPPTAPPPPFPSLPPPPGLMHHPGLPPHIPVGLPHNLPPHALHMPDGFPPPPFPPHGLPPPRGPEGFHPFDDRGIPAHPDFLGLFPPAWDPTLGPPPGDFFDSLRPSTPVRVSRSRSRSRSRSYSSGDSMSDYEHKKRHKRDRNRRRSRSRSRDRHRSSRHHRHDHRRERDRDRDRRDRRNERPSRHESSRHHRRSRSWSRDREEERSSSSRHKRDRESRETTRETREATRETKETKETQTPPP